MNFGEVLERGRPVSGHPDGAAALRKELAGFADLFLSEAGPFRSDTFANSFAGLAAERRDPKANQKPHLVRAADVFNAAQNLFPTHKLANGDSEIYIVRNVMPDADAQSRMEERRAQLFAPSLDAIRDTGIHWLTLEQALRNRPNVASILSRPSFSPRTFPNTHSSS